MTAVEKVLHQYLGRVKKDLALCQPEFGEKAEYQVACTILDITDFTEVSNVKISNYSGILHMVIIRLGFIADYSSDVRLIQRTLDVKSLLRQLLPSTREMEYEMQRLFNP